MKFYKAENVIRLYSDEAPPESPWVEKISVLTETNYRHGYHYIEVVDRRGLTIGDIVLYSDTMRYGARLGMHRIGTAVSLGQMAGCFESLLRNHTRVKELTRYDLFIGGEDDVDEAFDGLLHGRFEGRWGHNHHGIYFENEDDFLNWKMR